MIHKLYSTYDLPADHDVCHLFKHLVIQRFFTSGRKIFCNYNRGERNITPHFYLKSIDFNIRI